MQTRIAVGPPSTNQWEGGGGAAATDPRGKPGVSTGGGPGTGATAAPAADEAEEEEEDDEDDDEDDEEEEEDDDCWWVAGVPVPAGAAPTGGDPAGGVGTAGTDIIKGAGAGGCPPTLCRVSSNSGAVKRWSGGGNSSPGEIDSGSGLLLNVVASLRMSSTDNGGSKLSDSTTAHAAVARPSVTVVEPTCLRKTSHR